MFHLNYNNVNITAEVSKNKEITKREKMIHQIDELCSNKEDSDYIKTQMYQHIYSPKFWTKAELILSLKGW